LIITAGRATVSRSELHATLSHAPPRDIDSSLVKLVAGGKLFGAPQPVVSGGRCSDSCSGTGGVGNGAAPIEMEQFEVILHPDVLGPAVVSAIAAAGKLPAALPSDGSGGDCGVSARMLYGLLRSNIKFYNLPFPTFRDGLSMLLEDSVIYEVSHGCYATV
jgi:hypothetical protein